MARRRQILFGCLAILACSRPPLCGADDVAKLRLVPFPKQVEEAPGSFSLGDRLVLQLPAASAPQLAAQLVAESRRAGLPEFSADPFHDEFSVLRIAGQAAELPRFGFPEDAPSGSYALDITPDEIRCGGVDAAGLYYGVQTLCQLIRANRQQNGIPCLSIRDWPTLRWRCFQDDLTRGPSSTLDTLKTELTLGSEMKLNLFTYYMEYQYAFAKHPQIGPENGSLLPDELSKLVRYGASRHVDILGNQQSFGHLTWILKHPQFAELRETEYLICPTREASYQLLDDLYSEVCPLLPFEMFNVCCDETWGLGTGPAKELAEEIGVGGVYVRHIRRVHDLLKNKYRKRMMMWGDIILQHPGELDQIPKDTVMLTWGYGPNNSFEDQILPFAESGYEFFVCPGISNWSRILPDFGTATINIQNFVRDGVKHGAAGMLNTAWEDDGEALQGYKWHGYAWGAECAWNGATTRPEDFNRRIGGVLFGEPGDHFGCAIELLGQAHRLPGMEGMLNRRFWEDDFLPRRSVSATRAASRRLLEIIQPAIEHLEACKQDAVVNEALLDAFLLGARRMELIGRRMVDGLRAAEAYQLACDTKDATLRRDRLGEAEQIVRQTRLAYVALGEEFKRIWLSESKPYALDWTMKRYDEFSRRYADLADRVAGAREAAERGESLPSPEEIGLSIPATFSRQTRPQRTDNQALHGEAPWLEPAASHRLGIAIDTGTSDRYQLPVELDVDLPVDLASMRVRAILLGTAGTNEPVLAQLDRVPGAPATRLVMMIPGPLEKQTTAHIHVYLGLPTLPESPPQAVSVTRADDDGAVIQNDLARIFLGTEGAHVYRWHVKAAQDHDLAMPGLSDWSGFSDLGGVQRRSTNRMTCLARGPALARYSCVDTLGTVKTISLFGGCSWMEIVLSEPVDYYWDFDNPHNFAADGPSPGQYLFSNGMSGPVGPESAGVSAQVKAQNVHWAVKWNDRKLALGMVVPEVSASCVIGPGAGAGGVGIEASPPAAHFITFAGLLNDEPSEVMSRLAQTLDFRHQPRVTLFALQSKP